MSDIVKGINGQDGGTAFNGRTSIKTGRTAASPGIEGRIKTLESQGYYTFAHAGFDDNTVGTDLAERLNDVRYYTGDSPTDTPPPEN